MGASEHHSTRTSSRTWKIFQKKMDAEDTQPIVYRNKNDGNYSHENSDPNGRPRRSLAAIARTSLLTRRRLRLDPDKKLYFIYEPGRQVSSAVRIKNVSRSYVAFKFQTNAPKSCFMRPPHGVLAPKESILASVVKFVEQPDEAEEKKTTKEKKNTKKDKFKIVTLKVKQGTEYSPELFAEQRDYVFTERVLRVAFLDPQRPCKDLEKLKKMLDEADAIKQAEKKSQDEKAENPENPAEGIIDEWKERREKYLARQQEEVVDSF